MRSKTSLTPFLKPEYCNYKLMNKIDLNIRKYVYLSLGRNHPSERYDWVQDREANMVEDDVMSLLSSSSQNFSQKLGTHR